MSKQPPLKGRTRKRTRGFVAIPYILKLTLGALVDLGMVKIAATNNPFGEDIYVISVDVLASMTDHTAAEGPVNIGLAHNDLSTTEIGEALDAELTDPDDIIQKERGRRPVRRVGVFPGSAAQETLNNGNLTRIKVKFSIGNDHSLAFYARNISGGTFTTGTLVFISGTIFGRWQR